MKNYLTTSILKSDDKPAATFELLRRQRLKSRCLTVCNFEIRDWKASLSIPERISWENFFISCLGRYTRIPDTVLEICSLANFYCGRVKALQSAITRNPSATKLGLDKHDPINVLDIQALSDMNDMKNTFFKAVRSYSNSLDVETFLLTN